jgi:hypothetical protein
MGRSCTFVLAAFVALATVAPAGEKEEKVPLDKIPKKVKAAVESWFPDAKITSAAKEKADEGIVYDIELTHKGRKYEMDIKADGTVIEIEKEIALKDVPEAVKNGITAKHPKATIKEVMEVNKVNGKKLTPDHYEVTLQTADNKMLEVTVSLDGKTVK